MLRRYLYTLKHLKPIQIRYQLWYRLRHIVQKVLLYRYKLAVPAEGSPLVFESWIEKQKSISCNTIEFLNIAEPFDIGNVQWNFSKNGKLWAYNLNYMDYLLQPAMDEEYGYKLINKFIDDLSQNKTGLEPYPIALRGINWIKFLSKESISDSNYKNRIDAALYAQYKILSRNIEYHLLGNHLLEDGLSLLFGAFYFRDEQLYNSAEGIIQKEMEEQILADGGHFELSTMYHQILLDRMLDCINLLQNNKRFESQDVLLALLIRKSEKMLGWLNELTFSNGEIPLVNDSAPGIAPSTKQLNEYAERLGFISAKSRNRCQLDESGYRVINENNYECVVDIGQIGPSYQPGHAHADTFNFCLNVDGKAVIIDPGISTYNAGPIRMKERGTAAHNTVTVCDSNSSEIWSAFRVARRANVTVIEDNYKRIHALHYGYSKWRTYHYRSFDFYDNKIELKDLLKGKKTKGISHLWFDAALKPVLQNDIIIVNGKVEISLSQPCEIKLIQEKIPDGYNRYKDCYKAEIKFEDKLKTFITISQ